MMRPICPENRPSSFRQYFIILKNVPQREGDPYIGYIDKDKGVLNFWDMEVDFTGRTYNIVKDAQDRLAFVIANMCGPYCTKEQYTEYLEDVTEIVKKLNPKFKEYRFEEVRHIPIGYTPYAVELPKDQPVYETGWPIDNEELADWAESHEIDLEDFITNDKYMVIIEHAENQFFKTLLEEGYINPDSVENYDELIAKSNEEVYDG